MTEDLESQKFMAKDEIVQWLAASVQAGQNLKKIYQEEFPNLLKLDPMDRRLLILRSHAEGNFLSIAAKHVLSYIAWVKELDVYSDIDFSEIGRFSARDITDLRNMREHVIEYFKGGGKDSDRWFKETPELSADASSVVGTKIGGRLDYVEFTTVCETILQDILSSDEGVNNPNI